MSRYLLQQRIIKKYNVGKEALIERLKKVKYVCLTADLWSHRKKSYLGVTLHYIDDNMHRVSVLLTCSLFDADHTGANIASELQAIIHQFELQDKVISTVTDNGSNFIKAFKEFGIDIDEIGENLPIDVATLLQDATKTNIHDSNFDLIFEGLTSNENENDEIPNDDDCVGFNTVEDIIDATEINEPSLGIHLRCASHTLCLVASQDAKNSLKDAKYRDIHMNIFAKLKLLWAKYNRPKTYKKIVDKLESGLVTPGKTRWNSLYDSVRCVVKKDPKKLNTVMADIGLQSITTTELSFLKEFLCVSKPIAHAIDHLQSDCLYSELLPTLFTIKSQFEELHSQETSLKYCQPLLTAMRNGFNQRFESYFDLRDPKTVPALIATCTDPFFKLKWLDEPLVTKENINYIESLVVQAAVQEAAGSTSTETRTSDADGTYFFILQHNLSKNAKFPCSVTDFNAKRRHSYQYSFEKNTSLPWDKMEDEHKTKIQVLTFFTWSPNV